MWFAGLIIGSLIGSLGGFASALLGAILGTIIGAVLRASSESKAGGAVPGHAQKDTATRLVEIERRVAHIYTSLADIHGRLSALEKPGARRESMPGAYADATSAAPQFGAAAGAMDQQVESLRV